jgi:GNAT superfamily N-acetyltransferase
MTKAARFFSNLMRLIISGKFSEAFFEIGLHLPEWLFAFDRGYGLQAEIDQIDAATDSFEGYRVIKAVEEHMDTILDVSRMGEDRIRYFLNNDVSCFVAAPPGLDWSSIGWFAYGKCFVRGMGFTYDFGNDPYTFALFTKEDARRNGLNRLIISASIEEAKKRGSTKIFSLVEFTNPYALSFHLKMGYKIFQEITYLKVLGLRMSRVRDLDINQTKTRIFLREPAPDIQTIFI